MHDGPGAVSRADPKLSDAGTEDCGNRGIQRRRLPAHGLHHEDQFLEGLTLTPLFGVPVPVRGSGSASANIYQRENRELVSSVNTGTLYLTAWTTIYSSGHDRERGLAILRGMAMRDLADRLAQAVCAGRS